MFASRNLRLCTKDCMCLYVCPTGASDTETGQIDFKKCIGCGACVKSCPSGAISLIPEKYPKQQPKDEAMCEDVRTIVRSKMRQEAISKDVSAKTDDPVTRLVADALSRSNRLMSEDLIREAGYMLPQSGNVRRLLEDMLQENHGPSFPSMAVLELLKSMEFNE